MPGETATGRTQPLEIAVDFAEELAKVGALVIALSYVGGMLTVNLHLGRNGFRLLGLAEFSYLAAGGWAIFFTITGLSLAYLIGAMLRAIGKVEVEGVPKDRPQGIIQTAVEAGTASAVVTAPMVFFDPLREHFVPAVAAGSVLIFLAKRFFGADRTTKVVGLVAAVFSPAGVLVWAMKFVGIQLHFRAMLFLSATMVLALLLWATSRDLRQAGAWTGNEASTRYGPLWALLILCTLFAPAYFGAFSFYAYPDIPYHLGGGRAVPVRLVVADSDRAVIRDAGIPLSGDNRASEIVELYFSSAEELMVKVPGRREGLVLRSTLIAGIIFPDST